MIVYMQEGSIVVVSNDQEIESETIYQKDEEEESEK